MLCVYTFIKQCVCVSFHALQERFLRWMKPPTTSLVLGTLADLTRGKSELLAENTLLRHLCWLLMVSAGHNWLLRTPPSVSYVILERGL